MNPTESFEQPQANEPVQQNLSSAPPRAGEGTNENEGRHPLRPLVDSWLEKITGGIKYKHKVFTAPAQEVMHFFHGGIELNQWMWGGAGRGRGGYQNDGLDAVDDLAPPGFRYTMNKVAEVQQLFAPTLYYANPERTVTPRKLKDVDPAIYEILAGPPPQITPEIQQEMAANPQLQAIVAQAQQSYQQQIVGAVQQQRQNDAQARVVKSLRAELMEEYLNWTPNELDLKTHSRRVIDETLLKGMGVWWTEIYVQRGFGSKLVGSFFDSIDNLVFDPDVQLQDDCMWAVRIRHTPQWDLEDVWGLSRGSLDGAADSSDNVATSSETNADPDYLDSRQKSVTNKMVTSYEIWSKMGLGGRMIGIDPKLRDTFDGFGDYCHLVVVRGIPYPLNLPSKLVTSVSQEEDPAAIQAWAEQMRTAVEWPVPVWAFSDGWPFTTMAFHEIPNRIYPMSHFSTGIGELKWINWAMSWLASKVKNACGTIIAVAKGIDPEEKRKCISVGDQRVVEVEMELGGAGAQDVRNMIAYVQQPNFHPDIYNMIDRTAETLDKRWGVSALLYGMTGEAADRSATETNLKQQNSSIRLRDMADRVQDKQAMIARKEAFLARWFLTSQDVQPALGPDRAMLWERFVQCAEIEEVVRELDYRIEAGTMQILDRQAQIGNLQQVMQTTMPFFQGIAREWGEVGPLNALLEDWGKLMNMDVSRYMVQPPQQFQSQPPPGAPAPQGGPPQPGQPGQSVQPRPGQHGVEQHPGKATAA